MQKQFTRSTLFPLLFLVAMGFLYFFLGYRTPRTNFPQLITLYLGLFGVFYMFWLSTTRWSFWQLFGVAAILRLVLIAASPELSNDFYRFIWDGELMNMGYNPFAHKPDKLISYAGFYDDGYMRMLYHGMGELSQEHYTCYPVLNQFLFYIPTSISNYFEVANPITFNVVFLKVLIILADLGAIIYARKIAQLIGVNVHKIWLYALNPFIILEFSGNLHFEGVMIFFLLLAIYHIIKGTWMWSAVFFGMAVQIKLIPLMLLPFLFKRLGWKLTIGYLALTGIVVLGIGGILLNESFFQNMMDSVNEYFVRFQFNSSLYNLMVNFYYAETDWDRFADAGKLLSRIAGVGILALALFKAYRKPVDMLTGMMFAFLIYYTFATTVHPWYVSLVLVFSIFTPYKFGLVWSLLIMLTYSAYGHPDGYGENYFLIAVEYIILFTIVIFELIQNRRKDAMGMQLKAFFGLKQETNHGE